MTMTAGLTSYQRDAVLAASPARLVTMLYDRLLVDLHRAAAAQRSEQWVEATALLRHAQDIVTELSASLDVSVWPDGRALAAVYAHATERLIHASIHRDPAVTDTLIELCEPLRLAWHEALASLPAAESVIGVA